MCGRVVGGSRGEGHVAEPVAGHACVAENKAAAWGGGAADPGDGGAGAARSAQAEVYEVVCDEWRRESQRVRGP